MNNNEDNKLNHEGLQGEKSRRKTGPTPKYGPDQAKKMVSMRLSPSALQTIKQAAEKVFGDSQADVIEKMMRSFPIETLQSIYSMSKEYNTDPSEIVKQSLQLYRQQKAQVLK